jgi:hypothetical protein
MTQASNEVPFWVMPITSLVAAIIGGLIVHFSSIWREKAAKRRELLVKGKMELWNLLDKNNGVAAESIGRTELDLSSWEEITRSVQLFGTDKQMKLWQKAMSLEIKDEVGPYSELMKSLQNDVRSEVGMKKSYVPYFWMRIKKESNESLAKKL